MQQVFFGTMGPLVSLACFCLGGICFFRGLRLLLRRACMLAQGLHASSVVLRLHQDGKPGFVPVFTYIGRHGEEFDIMGSQEYDSEESALEARRPLVYTPERADAGVARNAACFLLAPVGVLVLAGLFLYLSHFLLMIIPR